MKQPKFFQYLRIFLFAMVMIAGCVLGFLLTLRPSHSDVENRDLATFPAWNAEAFIDGTYTADIGLWYSDTFPFREELIGINDRLRGLYGIKTQTAQAGDGGDNIDPDETFVWDTSTPPADTDAPGDNTPATTPAPETESEPQTNPPSPGADHEVIKGYLVEGNHGYEMYYFNKQNSDRYARAVVQTARDLNGKAQVYCMVTPMSYAYGVSADTQKDLNASDCHDSIQYIYRAIEAYCPQAGVKDPVITLDAYSALEAHKDEYIFFRTDHHWTALGAHYASRVFLDRAGRDYPTLADGYTEYRFENFTGSLAGHTKHETPNLINHPDTILAYAPKSFNTVQITTREENTFDAPIVNPDAATAFSDSQRYRCFIDGDYPFTVAHNPQKNDGSSVLLIKESYGNAFLPMLVDSYEYVYAIDYRFYRTMSLADLVATYGIDTVLFLNNPVATSADYNVNCLEALLRVKSAS